MESGTDWSREPRAPEWIVDRLRTGGPTLVALSGGVDSAVTALLAHDALGNDTLAVTLTGPALPREELDVARAVVRAIGLPHLEVPADPLVSPEYRSNPGNRCYFCRTVEGRALRELAGHRGFGQLIDGVHQDDLKEARPGLRAMDEAGFLHPLAEAGWTKAIVRRFGRERGLPNWDRPSNACLASRVQHGREISAELLERIDTAEEFVRSLGFRRVRVRSYGGTSRVEVDPAEVACLTTSPLLAIVTRELLRLGFPDVTIDPMGYRARPGA
jgi:pyridinium-3,5-biscarboxylic acid mononucleotide sulfurtransferase